MTDEAPPTTLAEMLLAGPRGRRLLLEYALASELARNPMRDEGTFGHSVVLASAHLGHRARGTSSLIGDIRGNAKRNLPRVTPAEVVERLRAVELVDPTPEFLRTALMAAVDQARYWQEPVGEDILSATPEMHRALHRVAECIADSPLAAWWPTPTALGAQQSVHRAHRPLGGARLGAGGRAL